MTTMIEVGEISKFWTVNPPKTFDHIVANPFRKGDVVRLKYTDGARHYIGTVIATYADRVMVGAGKGRTYRETSYWQDELQFFTKEKEHVR